LLVIALPEPLPQSIIEDFVMLICPIAQGLVILTRDPDITRYPLRTAW
jgi:hypothetical protein